MMIMDSPRFWALAILLLAVSFYIYSEDPEPPVPVGGPEIDVEAERERFTAEEAPRSLLSFNLRDSPVVLEMDGTWEGRVLGTLGFSTSSFGFEALSSGAPLLFTQEADLALELRIDDRWFLEAKFLDGYDLNTYRAGYRGAEGEAVQYLGLGNAGLDFPSFPYLDLGGDSPSSIGVYGKFGGGDLRFHGLFRYDLSSREERVFVGNRERRYHWVGLDSMERGRSFVLPDRGLDSPPELYAEDEGGDLRDGRGKRWRRLGASEYGASAVLGLVELGAVPGSALAVSYGKNGGTRPWEASLGAYDAGGPQGGSLPHTGSGFLGEVSAAFGAGIDLRQWPQPGESPAAPHEPGRERLSDGTDILIIWERGGFSPFERMSRYRSPSSALSSASLVRLSGEAGRGGGEKVGGYEILSLEDRAISVEFPLYARETQSRDTWELQASGGGAADGGGDSGSRSPRARWPLVEGGRNAGLYLPGGGPFTADMALRFTGYGNAGDLVIGTDVIPNSVKVYRGGMEDSRVRYDPGSGLVILEAPPLSSEVIRISYLKRSQDGRGGSVAAGLGTEYQGEHFGVLAGLGLRWNLGSEAYSEGESASPGTVGLGALASWDYRDVAARLRGGFGLDVPDTTGLYRAAGMEGGEYTLPLPAEDSFISRIPGGLEAPAFLLPPLSRANRADLVYRNYRENQIGGPVLRPSDWEGATALGGKDGPYPVRDQGLGSQVLAAEFRFDDAGVWTAFQVPLGDGGAMLERAALIEVPFRMDGFDGLTAGFPSAPPTAAGNGHGGEFTVLLQFGALQGEDQNFTEYPAALVEKQIYPQPGTANPNNPAAYSEEPRIAALRLSDEDRRKLRGASFMRLVIVKSPAANRPFGGRVMLGAPILQGASFRAVTATAAGISAAPDPLRAPASPAAAAAERTETGSAALETAFGDTLRRLHPNGGQRILELVWDNLEPGMAVGVDSRVPPLPLTGYRSLNFFVRGPALRAPAPAGTVLRLFLAPGPEFWESRSQGGGLFLEAEIPLEALPASSWSRVELRYGDGERVRVNGREVEGARLRYRGAGAWAAGTGATGTGSAGTAGAAGGGGAAAGTGESAALGPAGGGGRAPIPGGAYVLILLDGNGGTLPPGGLALDEILLEDPVNAYRVSGGGSFAWNRKGTLVSFRNIAVIEDVSLETDLESGLRGAFSPQGEGTGGPQIGIAGRSSGETTILGTRLSVNLGFSGAQGPSPGGPGSASGFSALAGDGTVEWNGGHGISRSFGPLSLGETFSLYPAERRADHRFGVELSEPGFPFRMPLHARIGGDLSYQDETRSRRWDILLGIGPFTGAARFLPALSLETWTAWKGTGEEGEFPPDNYALGWAHTWALLVPVRGGEGDSPAPDLGEAESTRNSGARISLSQDLGPLGLHLRLEANARASVPQSLSQSESLVRLDIPLSVRAWDIGLRGERSFLRGLRSVGADSLKDAEIFGASLTDSGPLWISVPFYVWGDPEIPGKLAASLRENRQVHEYSRFRDTGSLTLGIPAPGGLSSLWLPGAVTLALGRTAERKLDLDFDLLDLSGTLNFSAANILGAWGAKPLFPFYASDEWDHTLEGAVAFPREEEPSWRLGSAARMGFFGFAGGTLSLRNNATLGSARRGEAAAPLSWAESVELQWDRPSERGLFKTLWDLAMTALQPRAPWLVLSGIPESPYDSRLTERLDLALDHGGEYLKLSILGGHEAHIIIPGRLDVSVFGELGTAWDEKTGAFSLSFALGTGLRVSF
jgi:hypothetical protein